MSKRTRILIWVLGILVLIPVVISVFGYVSMRISQPQMFEDPIIDTVAPQLPESIQSGAVLVYSKTSGGFRHGWSIDAANSMIGKFAEQRGWPVYFTENAAIFNDEQLARFAVVVWNNATGVAISKVQRESFQRWLEGGGGFVGFHAAGDGSHADWDWYTRQVILVPYNQHTLVPEHTPEAVVMTENRQHPATSHLPEAWRLSEEWYAWHENPRDRGANILITVDETTYTPWEATMGEDHPVVWSHELGAGRVFYSAFGHWEDAYSDPRLVPMMEQAIIWAGRLSEPGSGN